jgi:hypothetical protein
LLQRLAVVGAAAHRGVQAEAVASAHSVCLTSASLGITPWTVSTFCRARGPKAMR